MISLSTSNNNGLGELVKSLWLELNHCMVRAFSARNENSAAFYAGKTAGLRLALPLLRGQDYGCRVFKSRISFIVSSDEINHQAEVLKQILKQDFEALHEGGKSGLKKEWLEGHINAIGMSLALLQPCFCRASAEIETRKN